MGPRPCPVTGSSLPPRQAAPPPPEPWYPGVDDQVGADVHLLQVGVPLLPVPVLHLIRLVQVLQRGLCDMHTAAGDPGQVPQPREGGRPPRTSPGAPRAARALTLWPPTLQPRAGAWPLSPESGCFSPGDSGRLHPVGEGHVMGPHVVLPLAQPNDATQHVPRVYAHAHADVHARGLPHLPGDSNRVTSPQPALLWGPRP